MALAVVFTTKVETNRSIKIIHHDPPFPITPWMCLKSGFGTGDMNVELVQRWELLVDAALDADVRGYKIFPHHHHHFHQRGYSRGLDECALEWVIHEQVMSYCFSMS